MKFYVPLVTLLVGVAAQSPVPGDLNNRISPQIDKLANDVKAFPASGLDGASLIDSDSKDLVTIFNTATENAINFVSFPEADAVPVSSDISTVTDTLIETLSGLSAKKDDFNALTPPAVPLILSDLQKLNQSALAYVDELIHASPLLFVPAFVSVRGTWASTFAATIEDYTA